MVKLDFGCGPNKKEGFIGVDIHKFQGVDIVLDLRKKWPWKNGEVDEVHSSHFIEHLTGEERIHFFNELYRVLKKGTWEDGRPKEGFCTIITPHWASNRAYGDPTHKWPPVSEMFFYYLSREWRAINAPHVPFDCDFEATWGYSLRQDLLTKNQEYQIFALSNYKEVADDIIATVTKK